MINRLYIIITVMLATTFCFGQGENDSISKNSHKNAVFIELLGANGYSSLNYGRQLMGFNRFTLRGGIGLGYANYKGHTPPLLSFVLRLDVLYGNKKIKPLLGYAFSYNYDLDTYYEYNPNFPYNATKEVNNFYLAHAPNVGIAVKIWRLEIVPKYYLLLVDRSDYNNIILINWSGLQLKFNF